MHPCNYSFSCREVVVGEDGQKVLFSGGIGERRFSFKIDRNAQIYLVSFKSLSFHKLFVL